MIWLAFVEVSISHWRAPSEAAWRLTVQEWFKIEGKGQWRKICSFNSYQRIWFGNAFEPAALNNRLRIIVYVFLKRKLPNFPYIFNSNIFNKKYVNFLEIIKYVQLARANGFARCFLKLQFWIVSLRWIREEHPRQQRVREKFLFVCFFERLPL